jgi:biopolymer transport protein ExbD
MSEREIRPAAESRPAGDPRPTPRRRDAGLHEEEGKLELTPLIDVGFLILVFFMCLPFKTLEGKLQAWLPEGGIHPRPVTPLPELRIDIAVLPRAFREVERGPAGHRRTLRVPTEVTYRFVSRGERADSLDQVLRWIREAQRQATIGPTADLPVVGEIRAERTVPHMHVVAVLNKFAEAGVKQVNFFGAQLPGQAERRALFLPYPGD